MTRGIRLIFALASLAVLSMGVLALADSGQAGCDPNLRVQLDRYFAGATAVLVSSDGPFTIEDGQGKVLFAGREGEVYRAQAAGNGVATVSETIVGGRQAVPSSAASDRIVVDAGPEGAVKVSPAAGAGPWHPYQGEISICADNGRLRITDTVPLEEYLCGVLKPEIGASAPAEALKAQAVAARTYAIHNMGRLADQGADLDDTTRTQSYLGVAGETPAICQAVQATAGLVMTFDGQPIEAVYSTDCGGETAPGPSTEPYLQPVSDPDCAVKPAWTKSYAGTALLSALAGLVGQSIDKIASVTVETTDASGRAAMVKIVGANGQVKEVTGAALRMALGTDNLRSTLFTVATAPDGSFTFSGHGWGHGMGMCQQGAIALASGESAATYDQILKHYYTGIAIVPLTPALVAAAGTHRLTAAAATHAVSSSTGLNGGRS